MPKIILGQRPTEFSRTVKFPMLEGTDGEIRCRFKYRTKQEYAAMVDRLAEQSKITPDPATGLLPDYAEIMRRAVQGNGEYLKELLLGWDLEGEVNSENLNELADAYPAAASAIMEAYRVGCVEGKLGN